MAGRAWSKHSATSSSGSLGRLSDWYSAWAFPSRVVFAVASALAESVGAVLLIVGLGTRWAALAIGLNLAVAVGLELSKHSAAVELPSVYLIAIVAIGIAGAGGYSLDASRRRKR